MATFVLVHGGHHGGWAYRDVCRSLRTAGHDVFAPTLTGLGDRSHLMSETVSPTMHAQDIVSMLFYEDLRDVILVGHSYGGIPITLASEATDRIGQLVYLDAMVPHDGQTFFDLVPPAVRDYVQSTTENFAYPVMPSFQNIVPTWVWDRLCPQPAIGLEQPISLPSGAAELLPRTYLHAAIGASSAGPFGDWLAPWFTKVQQPPWRFVEYQGDHEALVSNPTLIAQHLLALTN